MCDVSSVCAVTRDRMGRMVTFMGRILTDSQPSGSIPVSRAVGVDEHTALLLDVVTGGVRAVGVGTAYVCSADHLPETCQARTPLTFKGGTLSQGNFVLTVRAGVSCVRLSALAGDQYSFASWAGGGVPYESSVETGAFLSLPYGPQ